MSDTTTTGHIESVNRLTRDLANAASTMTADEARFLVDAYYAMQENRKRSDNQVRAMKDEPHVVLAWLAEQSDTLENQIKRGLEKYTDQQPIGAWAKSVFGIGPVITAGMIAHIDIEKAPTAGHIWRFAGLDPTVKWEKGQKRPWNASLKTLCWKVGQSFMKFSNADECVYGKVYRLRKQYEIDRNERGDNAATAAAILEARKIGKSTEAYKHLSGGKLPPAQIDARARRYAVKLFLSHLQLVWWWLEKGTLPPKPYAVVHLEHAHMIAPPHIDVVPGLAEALAAQG
jgi:hypothetical protein